MPEQFSPEYPVNIPLVPHLYPINIPLKSNCWWLSRHFRWFKSPFLLLNISCLLLNISFLLLNISVLLLNISFLLLNISFQMAICFSGSTALLRPRRMVYVAVDTWAATESLIQGLERRLLGELPGLYSRYGGVLIGFLWILVMENIGFLLNKYV